MRNVIAKKMFCFITLGMLVLTSSPAMAQYSQIYQYYLDKAQTAIHAEDYRRALMHLEMAQSLDPGSEEVARYMNIAKRALEESLYEQDRARSSKTEKESVSSQPPASQDHLEERAPSQAAAPLKQNNQIVPKLKAQESPKPESSAVKTSDAKTFRPIQDSVSDSQTHKNPAKPIENYVELDEGAWSLQPNVEIEVPMDQQVVFRAQGGIKRFLVISPEILDVERLGAKEIVVIPKNFGRTFFHIWDSEKRWTFYIQTRFASEARRLREKELSSREGYVDSFQFIHELSWGSSNRGPSFHDLRRQSLSFRNRFSLLGPTPYGDFDASMTSYKTATQSTELTYYTIGLTDAEWKNFKDIKFRVFDANRYISDLTLPGRDFRGLLLDATTQDDRFSIIALRGQDESSFGALSPNASSTRESYMEAVKVSYQLDQDKTVAANYARAWGDDKPSTASDRAMSFEYQQEFKRWSLFSEFAYDENEYAQVVWTRYSEGDKSFFAKVRNVPRDYATILGSSGAQGEVGTEFSYAHKWGDADWKYFLDIYRDRENKNPEDENALNLDFNASYHQTLTDVDSISGNLYFIRTPGLLSDRQDFRVSNTYSHQFDFFNFPNARLSWTGVYQRSRSEASPFSDYNRAGLLSNFSLPINRHLNFMTGYASYYVEDVAINEEAYPSIWTSSLVYSKTFSDQWRVNASMYYRDEEGAEDAKSFLAGQDSLALTTNLTYSPWSGMQIFLDGRVRDVWAENSRSDAFMEADVRLGVHSEWDLGYRWNPTGLIEGFVFKDINANGIKEPDEKGIPGVRVKVGEGEAITDTDGWYFYKVKAASVLISLDLDTIPKGYVFQGASSLKFKIKHNHFFKGNFALTTESGIYGVVYFDENGNERPDNGDEFLNKVRMILDGDKTATTDSKGAYFFYNVSEGTHTLTLDLISLPMEYLPTVPLKKDVEITEGSTYIFHVPVKKKNPAK